MVKKESQPSPEINPRQARHLKGLGHHLQPLAMIGRDGITETVTASVQDILRAHELVKVKVQQNCPLERHEAGRLLAARTRSSLVQVLGRIFLLFKANPDLPPERRIHLPT